MEIVKKKSKSQQQQNLKEFHKSGKITFFSKNLKYNRMFFFAAKKRRRRTNVFFLVLPIEEISL